MSELMKLYPDRFRVIWLPSSLARKRWWENLIARLPLPSRCCYLFMYPTIFGAFLREGRLSRSQKTIILYTHSIPELGNPLLQAELLNHADLILFMSNSVRDEVVQAGLNPEKTRIIHFGVEDRVFHIDREIKIDKSVVLASRYSDRKGLSLLPSLVESCPDFHFIALGRGWEEFIDNSKLANCKNFEYFRLDSDSRDYWFPKCEYFLSLSTLEGGPVPLLEAIIIGLYPIVTDTGFTRDFITTDQQGIVLQNPPNLEQLLEVFGYLRTESTSRHSIKKRHDLENLRWQSIARSLVQDIDSL